MNPLINRGGMIINHNEIAINSFKKDDEADELSFETVLLKLVCNLLIILSEDQVLHKLNRL